MDNKEKADIYAIGPTVLDAIYSQDITLLKQCIRRRRKRSDLPLGAESLGIQCMSNNDDDFYLYLYLTIKYNFRLGYEALMKDLKRSRWDIATIVCCKNEGVLHWFAKKDGGLCGANMEVVEWQNLELQRIIDTKLVPISKNAKGYTPAQCAIRENNIDGFRICLSQYTFEEWCEEKEQWDQQLKVMLNRSVFDRVLAQSETEWITRSVGDLGSKVKSRL